MIINKYRVSLYDADGKLQKSNTTRGFSPEDAIQQTRLDPFWYREDSIYYPLKYPVEFRAQLIKE